MRTDCEPCCFAPPNASHKVLAPDTAALRSSVGTFEAVELAAPLAIDAAHDSAVDLEFELGSVKGEQQRGTGAAESSCARRPALASPPPAPPRAALTLGRAATDGPAHLVLFRDLADRHSLAFWAAKYLAEEVYGLQADNTLDAKSRDLAAFVTWFVDMNGLGDIGHWLPRDTQMYLNHLEGQGRAATTINRVFATLRRFARWANEQPGSLFDATGLPTRGVKELAVDEPDCQKLDRRDVHRLFKAADRLVLTETRKNQRPRRNRAILGMLYYTGLRVSELVGLHRHQYDGRYLVNVKRKGKARSKGLYVGADCRKLLDEYLGKERPRDAPQGASGALFAPNAPGGQGMDKPLTRRMVAKVLDHIAEEASKHDGAGGLDIHPHRLRHTFGAEYRERTGSDTETAAALGHTGLEYVGRYVRKTREERESVIDGL